MIKIKEITLFPGYFVSSCGKVFSFRSGLLKELGNRKNTSGYQERVLYKNGKGVCKSVHRLVAESWIRNIENKKTVNHISGNILDNSVSNLEWATASENRLHCSRVLGKARGERMATSKLKEQDVREIRKSKESCPKLSKKYKVSVMVIWKIKKRHSWIHVE